MLSSVGLHSVSAIHRVFSLKHDIVYVNKGNTKMKKRVFKTNGVNLKAVMYIPGMDYMCTYSNSGIMIFNALSIEAACVTIIKKLLGVIEFDGSYVSRPCPTPDSYPVTPVTSQHCSSIPDLCALLRSRTRTYPSAKCDPLH